MTYNVSSGTSNSTSSTQLLYGNTDHSCGLQIPAVELVKSLSTWAAESVHHPLNLDSYDPALRPVFEESLDVRWMPIWNQRHCSQSINTGQSYYNIYYDMYISSASAELIKTIMYMHTVWQRLHLNENVHYLPQEATNAHINVIHSHRDLQLTHCQH